MGYISKVVGDKVTLALMLTRQGNLPITGETPTLEIRRISDNKYFDFSAVADPYWVAAGGQRELVLTEDVSQPGYYLWTFDQGLYDDGEEEYTVFYRNAVPYPLLQVEVVGFTKPGDGPASNIYIHTTGGNTVVFGNVYPDGPMGGPGCGD